MDENSTDSNEVSETTDSKKSSKALIITIVIFLLFLLLIGYLAFSQSQNAKMEALVTPTPVDNITEAPVEGTPTPEAEDNTDSVTSTPAFVATLTPTKTPTQGPTPTTSGPGGFQNPPSATPKPTGLPLSPN